MLAIIMQFDNWVVGVEGSVDYTNLVKDPRSPLPLPPIPCLASCNLRPWRHR